MGPRRSATRSASAAYVAHCAVASTYGDFTGEDQRRVGAAARGRRREGSAFLPFGRAAAAKASKRPSEKALLLHVLYLHWGGAQQRHVMMGRRWVRVARSLRLVTQMLAKKKKKARG